MHELTEERQVYHNYANCIISLFDLHVAHQTYEASNQPPLEILDTGTGHGSVTLSLARAIQAANPPMPLADWGSVGSRRERTSALSSKTDLSAGEADAAQVWQEWRNSRRAVVHSVEISPTYSRHAEKTVVAGFRRGLYLPHIDFHVADIRDWIDEQLGKRRNEPFLGYAVLDVPDCHRYLDKVASALKEDALIIIFAPSISQIGDCVRKIRVNALPLRLEKALELGEGISTGRLWDIRLAVKRSRDLVERSVDASEDRGGMMRDPEKDGRLSAETLHERDQGDHDLQPSLSKEVTENETVMVCRPKVGVRLVGGGFIGLWRRTAPN
jgi:hypothetical protein